MIRVLLTLLMMWCVEIAVAQISTAGILPSERFAGLNAEPVTYTMAAVDVEALKLEDAAETKDVAPRFGAPFDVAFDMSTHGEWTTLANGDRVWRLRIASRDALSINLYFDRYYVPPGAELYLTNDDHSQVAGAFTAVNNNPSNALAVQPVKGDAIIIEYYEPAAVSGQGHLRIAQVVHAYRNLFAIAADYARDFGDSGSCNNDVACPVANGWTAPISSVALIIVGGFRSCTGAMVNNTAQDGTPYFLTAAHCGPGNPGSILNNWVFVFNYNSPTCSGPDGSLAQSVSGATVRAAWVESDFALLELASSPPPAYNVFFSGWNHGGITPPQSYAIHHPSGDVKKFSVNDDVLTFTSWYNNIPNTHWLVDNWEDGTTEPGSSGSPLYDNNQRIIGQLHGGSASCNSITEDIYGAFHVSWTGNNTNTSRLSNWLDPQNTGVATLDGFYPGQQLVNWDIQLNQIVAPTGFSCDTDVTPVIRVTNNGANSVNFFDIEYSYDGGAPQTFTWNGGPLNTFASVDVTLPTAAIGVGSHSFFAQVLNPNDSTDTNPANDTATTYFSLGSGNTIDLLLYADQYPEESTYNLYDAGGNVIYTENLFIGETTNTATICVPDGCYTLELLDSWGDGVFNPIAMEVLVNNMAIANIPGNFTNDAFTQFCLPALPTAAFDLENSIVCLGNDIEPDNTSLGASSYAWSFPGATPATSTDAEPTFSVNTPGNYTITLIATNAIGADTTTFNVSVVDGGEITVLFRTDAAPGELWSIVDATSGAVVASGGPYVGNNTPFLTDLCLPLGCYYLIASDADGDGFGQNGLLTYTDGFDVMDSITGNFGFADTIPFCVPTTLMAEFFIPAFACVGGDITPNNMSRGENSYTWTMPDATPASSTDEFPTFSYAAAGTYTVTLTVGNGLSTETYTQTVIVTPSNPITASISTDEYPEETTFAIYDSNNEVVYYGGPFEDDLSNYDFDLCLPDGCYTFVVYDWFGDGMCCDYGDGSFGFSLNGTNFFSGAQFTFNESSTVCFPLVVGVDQTTAGGSTVVIAPNPTTGLVHVNSSLTIERLEVRDVMGKTLQSFEPQGNAFNLDLSRYPTAWYMLTVVSNGKTETFRVHKQ